MSRSSLQAIHSVISRSLAFLRPGPRFDHRIFVMGGGHGSRFFINCLRKTGCRVHVRPTVAFTLEQGLDEMPTINNINEFRKRSGFRLDQGKTINENLVDYIEWLKRGSDLVLLGRISRNGPFLTRNHLSEAVCLVRHPLHAYVSWIGRQHPEAGQQHGHLDSLERAEWYAGEWNLMVSDYLNSGSRIIRFEYLPEDAEEITSPPLTQLLNGWDSGKRNYGILSSAVEQHLKIKVSEYFKEIYDNWEI